MSLGTDEDARAWLCIRFEHVPRETWPRLARFEQFLRDESTRQNLVSQTTLGSLCLRHIADSAQLIPLASQEPMHWLDLGSGAGFPGLIVALLSCHRVTMGESRRLRVGFLQAAAEILGVADRVEVVGKPLERITPSKFSVISARAFAPLPRLLELAHPFSTEKTRWLLPKGRSAQSELEQAADAWQGEFRLEPSLTDEDARIIIAEGVRPRVTPAGDRRRT